MTTTVPSWNPFAPGYTDDPYPQLAELREAAAVDVHPIGLRLVWRYQDVDRLLRDGFSVDPEELAPDSPMRSLVPDDPTTAERGGLSMLDRDPPDHTRLRRLVSRAFTPRAVQGLEPRIRGLVDECLDRLSEDDVADVVAHLAFPLPFSVISELLGMPPADVDEVRELSGLLVRTLEPVPDAEVASRISAARERMHEVVGDVVRWKRAHPADDLLSALIAVEDDGDALTHDELVAQVVLLYVAGHETTVSLIGGATLALLQHPDQLALLRGRPDLVENAVEEVLRYDPPVQMTRRITTADVTVADTVIEAGRFVVGHLAAANRDPRQFGHDADRFRITRADARTHLSFGAGVHHCLGAVLARLETRLAVDGLLQRFPRLALAGEPVWNGRINLRGLARLPVTT